MPARKLRLHREPLPRDLPSFIFLLSLSLLVQFYASFKGVSHDFVRAPLSQYRALGGKDVVPRAFGTGELELTFNCALYRRELERGRVLARRTWFRGNTSEGEHASNDTSAVHIDGSEGSVLTRIPPEWGTGSYMAHTSYMPIEEAQGLFYFTQGSFASFLTSAAGQLLLWGVVVLLPEIKSIRRWDTPTIQTVTLLCAIGSSCWYFVRYGARLLYSPCSSFSTLTSPESFILGFALAIIFFAAFTTYALLLPQWVREEEAMSDGGLFLLFLRLRTWLQAESEDDVPGYKEHLFRRGRSRDVKREMFGGRECDPGMRRVPTRFRPRWNTESAEMGTVIVRSQPLVSVLPS
ncbi:hypothetical protein BT96DRAFT_395415 [Gymnopus androsaceus JB14]|uniref:Uncharacterized protein n=1 Tax=Gymnopus androsaceus JB14 TaxID=1447944 RepID=A0A6A4I2R3_9AGAR|nr:hypothetical protein BT96DRAFT_395415 [Gymnopus androsaceus JB14]